MECLCNRLPLLSAPVLPTGSRDVQSNDGDSVLNATVTSAGSSMDEASCLRAQLAALNEKVKVLEAQQAPQPAPATGSATASQAVGAVGSAQAVSAVSAAQTADATGSDTGPSTSVPENASNPSDAENPTVRASDGNVIRGLDDEDGVLTQAGHRSPSPGALSIDVDREGEHDLHGDDSVRDYASSDNSDQEEFEEREEDDEVLLVAGDQPTGGSSTPYRQDFGPSDSEDESICSVSDDGGADRMERMLGAAQGNRTMPPPPPRSPRDPRVLAAAARAAVASAGSPKSLPERNPPPLPSTSNHSFSSPILAPGDGAPKDPEPSA